MSRKKLLSLAKHLFFGVSLTTIPLATSETFKKYHLSKFIEYNSTTNFELKAKSVIKKSYADIGFRGEVQVEFNERVGTISTSNFFDSHNKRAAHVKINPKFISQFTDDEIYAIAGHEAVHSLHYHPAIKRALAWFYLFQTCIFINFFENPNLFTLAMLGSVPYNIFITRKLERNADMISCKKLGTALPLISALEKTSVNKQKNLIAHMSEALNTSHGSEKRRIKDIKKFCNLSDISRFRS